MSCEGTGLGALGPLAGYWEKIQERSASLETCPWCAAKGQTRALRSYRISIQEVITLCTDPQCLFPLVSRPLEDVLASLVPPLPQTQTGRKRKSPSVLENGDSVPSPKSARSEEAVSQNESRPVVRITSAKLNGEDCFNKTKRTTPVQKERISQSEPTDMELVDKTLPETERGGANGYHKDSDWPIPEEMDQKVLDEDEEGEDGVFLPEEATPTLDKGFPLPEKTLPTSQLAVSFVDAESAPKEVICPLDRAVSAPEKTLSVSRVAVSAPETILPPLHLAVSASKKNVAALEKALDTCVTVPNLQDTVRLLEALIAPGEAVSLLEEALPVPGEAVSLLEEALPVPGEAVSLLEEALPVPGEAVSLPEEALPVPGEAVSLPEEALPVPGEAVSLLEEALPVPGEAVSLPEEALPVSGEAVSLPGEAVSLPEEALTVPGEAVSLPEEALPVPGEAVSLLEEALPVPGEAVSLLEEALPVPGEAVSLPEEALPVPGEAVSLPEEALPVPGEAVSLLEEALPVPGEAVSLLEEALPVPGEAVSLPEEALPVPGEAVSLPGEAVSLPEEALTVPGEAVSLLEEALPVPGEAVSLLEEALPVPGEAVSLLEEALPVPGEAVSLPEEALTVPGEAVSLPEEAVSLLEEALPVPGEAVSLLEEALLVPGEAVSLLDEALPVPGEAVSLPEEALPVPGEAVSLPEEALTVLEEASPGMKEGLSVLQKEEEEDEVLISLENEEEDVATPVALEAVSIPAVIEVVPALEKDEEDLPVFDEEEKIQEVCRPCSVDLSQSKVSEGHVAGDDEDDGPIRAKRRAHNTRQLSDEEREVSVQEDVEALTPPPKKKRGRPRKTHIIKYTQEVLPDFDPEVISTGELVPVPGPHLFWKNEHGLGWLDTLLVSLVHCRTLRDRRPIKRPTVCQPVWDLCERYDRACSLSTAYQHTGADGVVRVPSVVLQRLQTEMQAIRTAIFKLVEPRLKCKLGQNERLVLVLPLLLGADSWASPLFQHAYDWQFQCISTTCQHATKTKCEKTLTTFTKVVTDWHPLNAANQSRCSKCNKSKQARLLVLERLSPVFVLHFAEGLPDNDLGVYSFTFQQQRYSITTVLQYDQPLNHLVSWIRRPDGSWLEFDDRKHPDCVSHTQLPVPPREIHVVFWELETERPHNTQTPCTSHPENPTSTSLIEKELKQPLLAKLFVVNQSLECSQTVSDDANADMDATITADYIDNHMDTTLRNNVDSPIVIGSTSVLADVSLQSGSHDLSLPRPLDDTAVVEALTVSDDTDTTVTAGDPSIGSATPFDTFEGLSRDDIVTLTLVEVKVDSESRPLDYITAAPKQNGRDVCFLSAPRSETETPPSAHEIPTESETPSETDDEDLVERPTSPDTASEFLPDSSDGPSETDSEEVTPSPPKIRRSHNRPKMASNTPVAAAATTPMALPGNCGEIILPSVVSMMSTSYVEPPEFPPSPPPHPKTPITSSSLQSTPGPSPPPHPKTPITSSSLQSTPGPSPPPHPKTPITSSSLQSTPGPSPPPHPKTHWSYHLSQRQPSQLNHSTPNRFQQLSQSRQTPNPDARLKKPPPLPKTRLSKEDNEALPVKAAEMYGGFQARSRNVNTNINNVSSKTSPPTQHLFQRIDPQNGIWKTPSQPGDFASRRPPIDNTTAAYPIVTSLPPPPGVTELHKISSSRNQGPGGQVTKDPAGLSETETLRYKLLKKLKAKKKKLEKLNQMLGYQGAAGGQEVTRRPDCADLRSPSTVSSSTSAYDSPAYDEFFADLLSPATTASNLSPDSTGFLDMLTTNGQEAGGNLACGGNAIGGASQVVTPATLQPANHGVVMPLPGLDEPIMTSGDNFLEEFISGSANQQMETEALSAFDLFF
ncbi:SUMO-specific isopeptidase USPL1-like [Salvelinus fontinalis]|uniref:SUMO-specific isopeptidase USPL1-like n=1 Tax=Salvelinus fontinalis TaxID=8038 RepID=UPI0024857B9D|nr:SUMO-specific isopeptidase USPL1-like [Salvelinus fontinalis]